MLPEVLIDNILFTANIGCHSCLRYICFNNIKIIKKQGKYYYCNNKCFITV